MHEIMIPMRRSECLRLLLDNVVADLPEGRGTRRPMDVVILVEPVP